MCSSIELFILLELFFDSFICLPTIFFILVFLARFEATHTVANGGHSAAMLLYHSDPPLG